MFTLFSLYLHSFPWSHNEIILLWISYCKQWGIIPLPPGTLGQYQPLALGLVSWVQAWVSQAGGYLGTQTTQRGATSNLITFIDSLNIILQQHTWLQVTSTTHIDSIDRFDTSETQAWTSLTSETPVLKIQLHYH